MLVTCHECQAKYSVADEKVRGRTARVRCRRCSTLIEVSGESLAPPVSHALRAPAVDYDDATTTPSPSVRRAAVLPRDDERSRRDLFAPASEAPAPRSNPAVTSGMASGLAARNESSVLFSLSALGNMKRAEPAPKVDAKEDSGLIDLNALMAAPLTAKSVPPAMASEAPVGAFTRELSDPDVVITPRAAKKRGAFIGLGIAAAVLAVVGLQFVARSADRDAAASVPPPVTAPVEAKPAAAPPAPEPAKVAAATPSDAKPIVPSSSDDAPRGKGKHRAHHASAHATSHASSAPAAPPVANDPCHCHGNLMCAMKCSAH